MAYTRYLKQNGIKRYERINDLLIEIENEDDRKCFEYKNTEIIRKIVNNQNVKDVILSTYTHTEKFSYLLETKLCDIEMDKRYGTQLKYFVDIGSGFLIECVYDWHTVKKPNTNYLETVNIKVLTKVSTLTGKPHVVFKDTIQHVKSCIIPLRSYMTTKAKKYYLDALKNNKIYYGTGVGYLTYG